MLPNVLKSWLPASKKSARRTARLGVEYLEERLAPATLPPDIVVGRTLSAYTVAGVQNSRLDVTYTVYNQTGDDVTGVLLTTTLQSGAMFQSASAPPDRSGQNLAWSLGTVPGFGRTSVTLTVAFPGSTPLQIDSGARAFATLNAGAVTDSAPAAALVNRVISPTLLASTPDANTTDPFVQEQAARLDYDPQRIFDYLNDEVGYESYVGSLRGARGTMWSAAGNSLDEASLGVALLRASGIAARYAHGTLSDPLSRQLILSMFPASYQTVGYIPAGTAVADPANDPQLLAETRDHFWVQFDSTGTGFVNADSSGLPGGAIGAAFTTATSTFAEVADALRHKVRVKLDAETYSQVAAAFGLSNGISSRTVLDHTFNSVDLVGRPLSIGNFVSTSGIPGLVFSSRTVTYSPYIAVGDEALPMVEQDHPIRGTDFQEVMTNFPLGSSVLTGVFLTMTLSGPDGPPEVYDRPLVDRIGFAARNGLGGSVSVDPNGPPALSDLDIFTINALSGMANPKPDGVLSPEVERQQHRLTLLQTTAPLSEELVSLRREYMVGFTRLETLAFLEVSEELTRQLEAVNAVRAYFDRPRLTVFSSRVVATGQSATPSFAIDLRRDSIRAVAFPGQSATAAAGFNFTRGICENGAEQELARRLGAADGGPVTTLSAVAVFGAAREQGIPLTEVGPGGLGMLDAADYSAEAKARITLAVGRGMTVLVPMRTVALDGGTRTVAWFEINPATGESIGVTEDGGHQGITTYAAVLGVVFGIIVPIFLNIYLNDHPCKTNHGNRGFINDPAHKVCPEWLAGAKAAAGVVALGSGGAMANSGAVSLFTGTLFAIAAINLAVLYRIDPPVPQYLLAPQLPAGHDDEPNVATGDVQVAVGRPAGAVVGTAQVSAVKASGQLSGSWLSQSAVAFVVDSLNATNATVRDANGTTVGAGAVSLLAQAVAVSVSGNNSYTVGGTGDVSFYAAAATGLGVSANWIQYTATVTGVVSISLTTSRLVVNGQTLPAGTYTITAASAALAGSGPSSSPSFSGSASLTATGGTLTLGLGSGTLTAGGAALDLSSGATLTGYTGSLTVSAGGVGNTPDTITLAGTAAGVLTLSTSTPNLSTDQNTPVTFQPTIGTSLAGDYQFRVEAPEGWTASIDPAGTVMLRPRPGLQGGTYQVRLITQSKTNLALVAQTTLSVAVTPTSAGLTLGVDPDDLFTVPTPGGAQSPTAFRALLQNLGPTADTFTLSVTNLPAGFDLLTSGTSVTVPAGETGILGVYLRPNGATLPAPGTPVSFTVTATSTTNPAITETRVVNFTMPAVHGVTFTATPTGVGTMPGTQVTATLTLTAVGNVTEMVTLSTVLSAGLTATGIPPTVTLNPGQTVTIPVTLTPAANTPLNSTLAATITVAFNPLGDVFDQVIQIPVRVVVPGADAIANASTTATLLGNGVLATQLGNLATALTNLVQTPGSAVFRGQAVAAITPILGQLGTDPFLAPTMPDLVAAQAQLAGATTPAEIQAAVTAVADALADLDARLTDVAAYGFDLFLSPNAAVSLPATPAVILIGLTNRGTQPTTYDLSVTGLPGNVTAVFNHTSVTLQPGETLLGGANGVTLSLTQTGSSLVPLAFTVRAVAQSPTQLTLTSAGALTVRDAFVRVTSVTPSPAFTDPGVAVTVSAQILNAVNTPQTFQAGYGVRNAGGAVVFTSPQVPVTLGLLTSLVTVPLGSLDTTGFALGSYTIEVAVTDAAGVLIAGGTGTGTLLLGSPVTASLAVSPSTLPPGNGTVTNTLTVHTNTVFPSPLTLVGQVATGNPNSSVSLLGNLAYVTGRNKIDVVDVSNPANPVIVDTFGQTDLVQNGDNFAQVVNGKLVVGTHVSTNAPNMRVLVYDLTNPLAPVLTGQTTVPYPYAYELFAQGSTVYLAYSSISWNNFSGGIFAQNGNVLTVDISNPAAPVVADANGVANVGPPVGGPNNFDEVVGVTPTVVYAATTTSTGGNTAAGVGRVAVIDSSDPANLTVIRTLDIPGTVHAASIAIQGNRALVVGTTGGWNNPTSTPGYGYVGNIVLTVLDIADPLNPVVLGSLTTESRFALGRPVPLLDALALGNGQFAVSATTLSGQPVVMMVDITDPARILVGSVVTPDVANAMEVSNGHLYVSSPTGLSVYQIGTLVGVPVSVSVRVPTGTGVGTVAGSFNSQPSQVIPGAGFDTLVWTRSLGFGSTDLTFTWQSTVTALQPGQGRDVTLGGTVAFTTQGTPATFPLPATTVSAGHIVTLAPPTRTAAPGGTVGYAVGLTNPTNAAVTYTLSVQGVPADWVTLPTSVTVGANGSTTVTLQLTPDVFTLLSAYGFTVTARGSNGANDAVGGSLTVAGIAPVPDPAARGVVLSLTPTQATAGQGTPVAFVVRVTNVGSETETFVLSALGLPPGVTAAFGQASVSVPPGAENFREVRLILTPAVGTAVGTIPFGVSATSAAATGSVAGTLSVAAAGVRVTLTPGSSVPGATLTATVTNTGTAADTFDLAATGPGGLVATLGTLVVTLAAGESRTIPLATTAAAFAVQGDLAVGVTAVSRANPAVRSAATAALVVPPSVGLTASFDPPSRTIASPGETSFTLLVNNTGNTEDQYEATITGITGPLTAALVGLDGLPAGTVPIFRLPGLSSGAVLLRTTLTAIGTGTVTVTVRSMTAPNRYYTLTAAVGTPVLAPTAAPQSVSTDSGAAVTITLGGSDPNNPSLSLTYSIVTPPAHGTLGPVVGNTVTYTPSAGYVGQDAFTFAVTNGAVSSPAVAVDVTVRPPRPVLFGYREFGVGAGAGHPAVARFFNPDGSERFARNVFPGLTGGVRVTSADFNGDGVADLVAGTGPGSFTRVVVLDGVTGAELFSTQPFEDRFVGGVFVAAGDVTGDGVPDLVITPDESGGPRARVFSGAGFAQVADFFGIDDPDFRGGARAAVGDVNGDGFGDLVVSAGFGGGPRISVIDGRSVSEGRPRRLVGDFFLFEEALRNGAYVAAGDVDGDGFADVIGGGGPGGGPRVFALSGQDLLRMPPSDAAVVANFFGGNADNRGGIRVVARDLDGDRRADLVVGDGTGAGSRVTGYLGKSIARGSTPPEQFALDAFPGFAGGVFVG